MKLYNYIKLNKYIKRLRMAYCKLLFGFRHNMPYNKSTNIFDTDWDLLIVLDAYRADLIREVAPEFDFLPRSISTTWSGASTSTEWIESQFTGENSRELNRTVYITGNPFSNEYLNHSDFQLLDEVWRYAWDDDAGGMPARPLTDRAIEIGRESSPDRVIVHYMQPHFPSFPQPLDSETPLNKWDEEWNSVWDKLRDGLIDSQTVWESYRENLRYVLEDVRLLLSNFDAERAIITADHGNAFGECGLYGHPAHYPASVLRNVPWVSVQGTDRGEYDPQIDTSNSDEMTSVEDRLRNLGYR